jgi:ATP-dependent Clp protease ATP-binding subunit ClpX
MEKVKLSFTKESLRTVAKEALRRHSGARGLRAIMEDAMLDVMYDVPFREGVKECRITEGVILKKEAPQVVLEKEKKSA